MTLLTRLSRLFQADFHAVMDSVEEPVALLKQAVREMNEHVQSDERRAALLEHELEALVERRAGCARNVRQINEELDVCLAASKDDLARTLLKRRLENEKLDQYLATQVDTQTRLRQQLLERLKTNRPHLDTMRQKLAMLAELETSRGALSTVACVPVCLAVSDDDIEVALLREKQRRMPA